MYTVLKYWIIEMLKGLYPNDVSVPGTKTRGLEYKLCRARIHHRFENVG